MLSLPALAEEDDALGRKPGEALCPGLGFGEAWMERTRAEHGTYWFSALYQQAPRPLDGLMFRREDFRYFTYQEDDQLYCLQRDSGQRLVAQPACVHFQTVDVATSEKQTAAYTVVSTWAATPDGGLLLLDCQCQRSRDRPAPPTRTDAEVEAGKLPCGVGSSVHLVVVRAVGKAKSSSSQSRNHGARSRW